jgi:hypothetical protein
MSKQEDPWELAQVIALFDPARDARRANAGHYEMVAPSHALRVAEIANLA